MGFVNFAFKENKEYIFYLWKNEITVSELKKSTILFH